jgi:hypothetical protein
MSIHEAQGSVAATTWRITLIWIVSRVVVLGAALAGGWTTLSRSSPLDDYVHLWRQWDASWYESIAVYGYVGPYVSGFEDFHYNVAFFPALPLLMKAGMAVGITPVAAGLIVSVAAGLAAALALGRLVRQVGGSAEWGVIGWVAAPTAMFLAAAYTESLFAAFAFWAWVHARERNWVAAGVLAGCAALVRPNGLFLGFGLIVMFVLVRPRTWLKGSALLLPFVATAGYVAYLRAITGSWTAWLDAERAFWDRHLVDPITSLLNTYHLIFTFSPTGEPSSRMVTEIIAMALVVGFAIVLIVKRWWAEAAYVMVTALSLGTSSMYHSVPRTLVVLFPVWMVVGLWLTRYRWLRWVYLAIGVPFLVLVTIRFTQGQWIS